MRRWRADGRYADSPTSRVPREVLERVLAAAAWAPSGSNLQPWHIYVVTGAPLAQLKKLAIERVAAGDAWDEREFVMYPPDTEIPVRRAPIRVRQGALQRTRHCARGLGGAAAGRHRELGLLWRARRPVLLHRPRSGPAPMGGSRDVSTDRHAAAPRRRAAQLPADGVVAGSQDRRGDRVTPGRAHAVLRHVDRVRGRHGGLHPYRPGAARRDGHRSSRTSAHAATIKIGPDTHR